MARSSRFAGFLSGTVLTFVYGIQLVVTGLTDWIVGCLTPPFSGACPTAQVWEIPSTSVAAGNVPVSSFLLFAQVWRARRPPGPTAIASPLPPA